MAADGMGTDLLWREECYIGAETGRVDEHDVVACSDFLNPTDAVDARVRAAVVLDLDRAWTASEIANCAIIKALRQIALVALNLQR